MQEIYQMGLKQGNQVGRLEYLTRERRYVHNNYPRQHQMALAMRTFVPPTYVSPWKTYPYTGAPVYLF
jgi:hypothetical protein